MTAPAPARPRLTRVTEGRALGGVAAGVAEHLGLPPLVIRGAFLVLALFGGVGIAMYAALWVVTPQAEGARQVDGADRVQLLALAALGLGGFLLLQGMGLLSPALLPLLVVGGGVALVWQQADEVQRARWRSARGRGPLIVVAGAVLVAAGLIGFAATRGELQAAREGLLFTGLAVLGLVLLSAPWWVRLSSDLRHERRERIRSQERAEVAAHVHDSVLQTLALIRKAADDPREVQRLVRTSERELRGWLYRPTSTAETAFAGALEQAAAEVEEAHGVTVEVVVVGDCPTSPPLLALVAAAREALVNAARHAGVDTVRAFAEVMPDRVEVFVRDRGCGFDPGAVPADRYGIAQSVIGRMERNGGTAVVRSSPGEGTEVRLEVARS